MDQKHAMLYPPLDLSNTISRNERISASAAIGLPTEAPPSYDMAMSAGNVSTSTDTSAAGSWMPSALADPTISSLQPTQPPSEPSGIDSVVILEQISSHEHMPSVPASSVVTSNTPVKLGPNPCSVQCSACNSCKTTHMCYTPNTRTHLSALLLCLVGWCCCACFVPYCMNSCRTGNHYCAKCNAFLGSFNPHENT